ncbi:hypothetical protein [Fulvimarina sp. MAC8]|uniref:hypothetical protein n=1 Tax=Fulvimarina sp. MAC8 TaxID=3162874 RepID=UPI0032EBD80A
MPNAFAEAGWRGIAYAILSLSVVRMVAVAIALATGLHAHRLRRLDAESTTSED